MLHHVKADLLISDCTFIAHQSNCLGGFGAGIAGQIRNGHPQMLNAFQGDPRKPEEKLGNLSYARISLGWGFNLYGQFNYGGQKYGRIDTVYPALEKALDRMLTMVPELARFSGISQVKVGLPYLIGCDRAGGDWGVVSALIARLSDHHKIDIYLHEHNPQKR